MTRVQTPLVVLFAATLVAAAAAQTSEKPKTPSAPATHAPVTSSDLKWEPAPPSLPPGAEAAVGDGDPTKAAPFDMRARFPAGYRVAPHFHPTDENLTVLSGSFAVGMGDK